MTVNEGKADVPERLRDSSLWTQSGSPAQGSERQALQRAMA